MTLPARRATPPFPVDEPIRAHQSIGSEANGVIQNFLGLTENQKQDLYNFLRSL